MLEYQEREWINTCAFLDFLDTKPTDAEILAWQGDAFPDTPKTWKLWFIGLKVWGIKFAKREYELSERAHNKPLNSEREKVGSNA